MPDIPEGLVPARYIGSGIGLREGMSYYNVDGSKREDLLLEHGDTMLLRDEDVYGKTLLHDPQGNKRSEYIGLGKVVKPEHAGKSDQDLWDIGYEWHLGRADFEPVEPIEKILRRREKVGKKERTKEIEQTITIEQPAATPAQEGEES